MKSVSTLLLAALVLSFGGTPAAKAGDEKYDDKKQVETPVNDGKNPYGDQDDNWDKTNEGDYGKDDQKDPGHPDFPQRDQRDQRGQRDQRTQRDQRGQTNPGYPNQGGGGNPYGPDQGNGGGYPGQYSDVCEGQYVGNYSNGTPVIMQIQRISYEQVVLYINAGGVSYQAQGVCQSYGPQAQLQFVVYGGAIPLTHQATITQGYNGMPMMQGYQSAGFSFNLVRQY